MSEFDDCIAAFLEKFLVVRQRPLAPEINSWDTLVDEAKAAKLMEEGTP